jgi:hypothetical protein
MINYGVLLDKEAGTRASEIRYMPWDKNRWSYGTTPTTMRYTGQRQSTAGDDGLRKAGGMLGGWRDGGMVISCRAGVGVRWVMSAILPTCSLSAFRTT